MTDVEYIGRGGTDGTCLGSSATEKISFYGATPIVRAAKPTALGTVVFSAAFTGMWAFSSSTVAKTIAPRIDAIVTRLVNLGLLT